MRNARDHGLLAAAMMTLVHSVQPTELLGFDAVDWNSPLEPVGINHKRVYRNTGWVDTKQFSPKANKNEEFTVLFVGRHDYGKGFDKYVALSETMTGVRFTSTGDSVGRIKGLGNPSDRDLCELYSRSTVLVSPARGDTFGRVLLEGLACGTPVITTSISAHTALDLPFTYADTIEEMAHAIVNLVSIWKGNKEEYYRRAAEGVNAASKYDVNSVLPGLETMLKEVAILGLGSG